ncbi:MAG: SU10 major capsid protein [Planctomycetota bacterium]|jgi:hypothetical protein
MALTTSAWMAAPGLIADANQFDKLDVSDVLSAVLLKDTATLGQIPMKGTAKGVEHYWIEDSLNFMAFSAQMSSGSATIEVDDADISTTAQLARVIRTGALLMPEGQEFVLQVIDHSSVSITTTVLGSLAWTASLTATTRFFVVGQPYMDELDASPDISRGRTRRVNFTQIFERGIEIAETREHIDLYAVSDELKQQIKYRTLEVKRELNAAVLMGYTHLSVAAPVPGNLGLAGRRVSMAGIIQFLRDPDFDSTNEDTLVNNAAGGALTMARINTLTSDIYNRGGFESDSNCCVIVGPGQARVIALLEEQRIRKSSSELVVGTYANKIKTDLGFEMDVIVDRWCPADKLIVLDRNAVKLLPLQGDSWHLQKMAKTGRTTQYQLSGQYTLEIRNAEERHGMIYGLAFT